MYSINTKKKYTQRNKSSDNEKHNSAPASLIDAGYMVESNSDAEIAQLLIKESKMQHKLYDSFVGPMGIRLLRDKLAPPARRSTTDKTFLKNVIKRTDSYNHYHSIHNLRKTNTMVDYNQSPRFTGKRKSPSTTDSNIIKQKQSKIIIPEGKCYDSSSESDYQKPDYKKLQKLIQRPKVTNQSPGRSRNSGQKMYSDDMDGTFADLDSDIGGPGPSAYTAVRRMDSPTKRKLGRIFNGLDLEPSRKRPNNNKK